VPHILNLNGNKSYSSNFIIKLMQTT